MRRSTYILKAVVESTKRNVPVTARASAYLKAEEDVTGCFSKRPSHLEAPGFGGECLIFLACARDVPTSCKQPVMMAWAEQADGTVIGNKAEWISKPGNQDPAWSLSKPLGFKLKENLDAFIVVELTDRGFVVGLVKVPLMDLLGKDLQTHTLEKPPPSLDQPKPNKAPSRMRTGFLSNMVGNSKEAEPEDIKVQFQVVDASAVRQRRTVFFVRHAESAWNNAQSKNNFFEMFKTTDHPLSSTGGDQAEELSTRIAKMAKKPGESKTKLITDPDVIYVSPLTRAVQTAVIALQHVITSSKSHVELVLMANAREKQNFGGLDTKSSTTGADVAQRALNETRTLFQSRDNNTVVESFKFLRFDVQEVQEQWWHADSKESMSQLDQRLDDFMAQLLYTPHHSVVVVGHSHFFREVFRRYLSEDFCRRRPGFVKQLQHRKLMNCGVARLEMDPSLPDGLAIDDVELVLGTVLLPKKPGLFSRCCCCGRKSTKKPCPITVESE